MFHIGLKQEKLTLKIFQKKNVMKIGCFSSIFVFLQIKVLKSSHF